MAQPTIVIADDHPLFRDALKLAVDDLPGNRVVAAVGDFQSLEAILAGSDAVEMVLLDLSMPGNKGLAGLLRLRTEYPAVSVVVVSATDDAATIRKAMDSGAAGFVPKSTSMSDIRAALLAVLGGDEWFPDWVAQGEGADSEFAELAERMRTLTPQQSKVLSMLAEGLLNKQIAYELSVSEATIKAHVSAVLLKLGVDSRTQAVIALGRLGLPTTELSTGNAS